jgi:hypothetical protein
MCSTLRNEEVIHIVASKPTHTTTIGVVVEFNVCVYILKYPTSKVHD